MRRAELALEEVERVESLVAESARLDQVLHTGAVMSKEGLRVVGRAQSDLQRRTKLVRVGATDPVAMETGLAKLRKAERIARRKLKG